MVELLRQTKKINIQVILFFEIFKLKFKKKRDYLMGKNSLILFGTDRQDYLYIIFIFIKKAHLKNQVIILN